VQLSSGDVDGTNASAPGVQQKLDQAYVQHDDRRSWICKEGVKSECKNVKHHDIMTSFTCEETAVQCVCTHDPFEAGQHCTVALVHSKPFDDLLVPFEQYVFHLRLPLF
jgi:hypothetical protein